MHYAAFALGVFLAATPAHAQQNCGTNYTPGCSCNQFGATHLSADGTNIVGCLYTNSSQTATVWKAQYSGGAEGGSYVLQSGQCLNPNYLLTPPICGCPSGYTPSPVNNDVSNNTVGYICYSTLSTPQTGSVGVWSQLNQGGPAQCEFVSSYGSNLTGQPCLQPNAMNMYYTPMDLSVCESNNGGFPCTNGAVCVYPQAQTCVMAQ